MALNGTFVFALADLVGGLMFLFLQIWLGVLRFCSWFLAPF